MKKIISRLTLIVLCMIVSVFMNSFTNKNIKENNSHKDDIKSIVYFKCIK